MKRFSFVNIHVKKYVTHNFLEGLKKDLFNVYKAYYLIFF